MRTIGLLGGMSAELSMEYERLMTQEVRRRLGPQHSASLVIRSYDFADDRGAPGGRRLGGGGAQAGRGRGVACRTRARSCSCSARTRCTASPTRSRRRSTSRSCTSRTRPVRPCVPRGVRRVGLLGTRYTMEQDFYRRSAARRCTGWTSSCRTSPIAPSCTTSSTASWCVASSARSRAGRTSRWIGPARRPRRGGDHRGLHRDRAARRHRGGDDPVLPDDSHDALAAVDLALR